MEIYGYRSIRHIKIDARQMAALIGQNGSGKSNILMALRYFYGNLTEEWDEPGIFDVHNTYHNEVRIRIVYDLKRVLRMIRYNQNQKRGEYSKYYRKINAISQKDQITLELCKRKGQPVAWNVEYNTRQIVASLFPAYFVDARRIELTNWSDIWDLIGDVIKLRYEDSEKLHDEIGSLIGKPEYRLDSKLKNLSRILEDNGVNLKKMTPRQMGRILSEISLNGQIFQYDNHSLSEYSNGTNAYNYTCFLMDILCMIRQYKLKEPIVILDEPEISLHIVMMDQLMERIFQASSQLQFFLSTHSSRCVKKILECEDEAYDIYHVALCGKYSQLRKVRNLENSDTRERVIATENYMNSCFAKMVLNVEGATELEVFKNKYLRAVFPKLNQIEMITGMSNQIIYNLTAPSKRNYQTVGLGLVDMDKCLQGEKDGGFYRFRFKKLVVDPQQREACYYGKKRRDTLNTRRRIESMCQKCSFHYELPFYSCEDPNFDALLELIRRYYEQYHIYTWRNTIEGALITDANLMDFIEFMKGELTPGQYGKVEPYLQESYENRCLNYVRMVFGGKSDFLLSKGQLENVNDWLRDDIRSALNLVPKTSGWISRWLACYFLRLAGISETGKEGYAGFCEFLREEENLQSIRRVFRLQFPELSDFVEKICRMVT